MTDETSSIIDQNEREYEGLIRDYDGYNFTTGRFQLILNPIRDWNRQIPNF